MGLRNSSALLQPALAEPAEERLAVLARASGPVRRVLAALAGRFVSRAAYERLGYARLGDYARERLGLSARMVHELAQVDAKLSQLPQVASALVGGELPWSKVRLIARFATAVDEARWIARARGSSVRAFEHELRAVARGAIAATRTIGDEAARAEAAEPVVVRVAPRVAFKWHRTCRYAAQVSGEATPAAAVLEWVTAEVLAGLPGGLVPDVGVAAAGGAKSLAEASASRERAGPAANVCALQGDDSEASGAGERRCALPAFVAPLIEGLEGLDAFELDARLRRVVRLEQRREAEMASLLRVVLSAEYEWEGQYRSRDAYVRDELGMSPRKARALVRLDRVGDVCPALRDAFRDGVLSWVQAQQIAKLALDGDAENAGLASWVAWAATVSVRKLEETVGRALLLRATDPDGAWTEPEQIAATDEARFEAKLEAHLEERLERQTCAHPRASMEDVRLRVTAPRDVAQLFSRTLCSVRLAFEQQSGRLPSEGEAFEAMLDGALQAWEVEDPWLRQRSRREIAIFERDGWRCTIPGCSSRRNLHRHHIRFRSAGGSDAPENQTTLCAFHHLRGVHAGRVRVTGRAPEALCFELGTRPDGPPLVRYRSGD